MFTLITLPYPTNALEPYIDELTIQTHHGKHHQTYVTKLNAALENFPQYQNLSLEELIKAIPTLPEALRGPITNNAGQVYNHNIYWESLAPNAGGEPTGKLLEAINSTFENFEKFKENFAATGLNQFGSGWAWLSVNSQGGLEISATSNAESPLMHSKNPILTLDVWEHAYYLKYKNLRPDYISAYWNIVNWTEVSKKYEALV